MKLVASVVMPLLVLAAMSVALVGAQEIRPGRLDSEERGALEPGLKVAFTSFADAEGVADVGDARLAALYVAEGQPPTPMLPAGRFRAVMTGYVKLRLRGEYDFSLAGRGGVKLSLNDEVVLEAAGDDLSQAKPVHVELVKGYNKLRIEYESPAAGDAVMRLYWASDEFPAEPIFPQLLTHDGRDEAWKLGQTIRDGRLLFAQSHCLKCHVAPDALKEPLAKADACMPELQATAPSLAGVGSRLSKKWMENWVVEPAKLRNRTTMPQVLGHDGAANLVDVVEIAAYLATLKEKDVAQVAIDLPDAKELVETGLALFEDRGCIACHRFTPPGDEDEYDRVSLHYVGEKFLPGALMEFLTDTHRHYAWSRMPKFDLTGEEAAAMSAYIRKQSKGALQPFTIMKLASPARGEELFNSRGCAACHSVDPKKQPPPASAKPLAQANAAAGCLDENPPRTAPHFGFDESQRSALAAFLKTDLSSLTRDTPAEFSRRQFNLISCNACHSRDDTDAELPYALLDEGELGHSPEPVPDLTWAGEKLRPEWTAKLFAGNLIYRPRPHFKIRMPAFPQRGKLMSQGISAEHGFAPQEDARPKHDPQLAKMGEAVAAMNSGLACHRCHAIGDKQATAPFEARSTNLSFANDRLRHGFYHRWMRDPLRIDPQTKMIKFAQDGQKTGLTDFYDGDAHKQFEAVWHYLKVLNENEQPMEPDPPAAESGG